VTTASDNPTGSEVLGHQNLTWPLLVNTNGVVALAVVPFTVVPVRLPTVVVAPTTKFEP